MSENELRASKGKLQVRIFELENENAALRRELAAAHRALAEKKESP